MQSESGFDGFLYTVLITAFIGGPLLLLLRKPLARLYLTGQEFQRRRGLKLGLTKEDAESSIRLIGYVFCVILLMVGLILLIMDL